MVPRMVASGVMIRMSRAPVMTRDSTSRPSGSVPNQCAADGAVLADEQVLRERAVRREWVPEDRAHHPEQQDAAPTQNVGRRSSSRHLAGVARLAAATAAAPVAPRYPPVRSSGATGSTAAGAPGSAGCGTGLLTGCPRSAAAG